jgi:hypothetical protein
MATPPVINAALTSPADVINNALVRIGYRLRVGSLYDGSLAAKKALDCYAQTRDAKLRDGDWYFAQRSIAAVLLKTATAGGYVPPNVWNPAVNPPIGWRFSYEWPADCLKVRCLKAVPVLSPNFDPQPIVYSIANDNAYNPPAKVILCNVAGANLVYTGQVTDPTTWEPGFGEELCASLGRLLVAALVSLDAVAKIMPEEGQASAVARREQV